jgi:esterase/lipase superfamily enzyme
MHSFSRRGLGLAALALAACTTPVSPRLPTVPAPEGYAVAYIDPFADDTVIRRDGHPDILFATDREPAADGAAGFYGEERGNALRLGRGTIEGVGADGRTTWADARSVALLKDEVEAYPLRVTAVEEFGLVPESLPPVAPDALRDAADDGAMRRFIEELDAVLQRSPQKDVYIYVHGYKVGFEHPLLVAAELWHYLAYNGAFIAYAWPTGNQVWSYPSSAESAVNSARKLRLLLLAIAERSQARRVHILGYSAGTRLVMRTLADLGQFARDLPRRELRRRLKLDNVILVSSDLDRDLFSGYLLDGALRIPDTLSLYQYAGDGPLGAAATLFGRRRLGQTLEPAEIDTKAAAWLRETPVLRLIDAGNAPGVDTGNGHRYLRASAWVSADILMTLLYDLTPAQRGLERGEDYPVWQFPADYPERLRRGLEAAGARPFEDRDARGLRYPGEETVRGSGARSQEEEAIE